MGATEAAFRVWTDAEDAEGSEGGAEDGAGGGADGTRGKEGRGYEEREQWCHNPSVATTTPPP